MRACDDPAHASSLPSDDPELVAGARYHRLTPWLSATCGDRLPAPLAQAFRRDRVVTLARNMLLTQAAEESIRALSAEGVPVIVLKGLDYETRLYRTPGARPTSDVDLLIPEECRRRAFAVLDRLGFEPRAAAPGFDDPDYHEVAWTRAGVEIDLHMALAPLVRCRIDYGAVWADAAPLRLGGTEARALSIPHAIVFQALHMAIDHFQVPAIYLVDMALLWAAAVDADQVFVTAGAWRCRRPLESALALTATFMPGRVRASPEVASSRRIRGLLQSFGGPRPLSRPGELVRKFTHFDRPLDGVRYFVVQSRRNLREAWERRIRRRSARDRLNLAGARR